MPLPVAEIISGYIGTSKRPGEARFAEENYRMQNHFSGGTEVRQKL
jgi:hypothetical protein